MKRICGSTISVVLLMAAFVTAQWQQVEETEIHGYTMYTVFKPGDVPAIFEPTYGSVTEADEYYHSNEPLVIVADGDEVHAYSTWHLEDIWLLTIA